ncbi:AIPR family protein [Polynucleobacter sp. 31A-FELB]|jgi:hypothetical protein|uniref:AIPR family protein n=1 Tax=Polynucleobacter sp. 31A-FELB TaxID=2689096 RepID=UPI001C0AF48B|nr:AIPR family protein [Polynucleobacter sp. 31A-FELB]MBU3588251.1 AIPR family protein [Polynucleobacter sp. 31A-FELB]
MSVHVRQLEQYFENAITDSIDVKDLAGRPEPDIKQATLSRALTAFAISGLTGTIATQAADYVFDGERDQGIDGCFFDSGKNTLVFVQSKWNANGTKTIGKGDLLKFLHGVKLVLSANWDTFSEKFKKHKATIDQVLLKPEVSVIVSVAFTGDNPLGSECEEVLTQFQSEQNAAGDFLEVKVLDLRALHRFFRTATLSTQPPFTAMLLDWGQSIDPHQAIYGRICCEELAKLYAEIGESLFEPNIRSFLGDGEVNNQIIGTLLSAPKDFWYMNNGVTGICTKYNKTALGGGDNRQAGAFIFQGLQIVNGAQTIGSIAKAYEKSPTQVAKAFAMIKIISLEGTPLGFTDVITIATNKQNKVEDKDFLTLDPNQNRIKVELLSKGIQYIFRSGEAVIDKNTGFDVTEAMIALACSSSAISNAVLAKRNIGLLLDRKSTSYQQLFHSGINGEFTWEYVQKFRKIDAALVSAQANASNQKRKQLLTHGNRILSWAVFNAGPEGLPEDSEALINFIDNTADLIDKFLKEKYPDSYLAVFFKNTQKCSELATSLKEATINSVGLRPKKRLQQLTFPA